MENANSISAGRNKRAVPGVYANDQMQTEIWTVTLITPAERWFSITALLSSFEALLGVTILVTVVTFLYATGRLRLWVGSLLAGIVIAVYAVSFFKANSLRDHVMELGTYRAECAKNAFCDVIF